MQNLEMVWPRRKHALPIPMIEPMPEWIGIGSAVIEAVVTRISTGADVRVVGGRYFPFEGRRGVEAGSRKDRTLVHDIRRRKPPDLDLPGRRAGVGAPAA